MLVLVLVSPVPGRRNKKNHPLASLAARRGGFRWSLVVSAGLAGCYVYLPEKRRRGAVEKRL
jgi:hypothetical protein